MLYLRALAGGFVGGLIGAAIWAAIAYFTHREVGFVAWGVGGLVGLGVRFALQEHDGAKFGLIAVAIALLAIVAGKFAAVSLVVSSLSVPDMAFTDEDMIRTGAEDICRERQGKGQRLAFPAGKTLDTAEKPADFPPGVWTEAEKRWKQVPPAEQKKQKADRQKELERAIGNLKGELRSSGFRDSFSPFDILWALLAAGTAFRLGSGAVASSD